MSCCEVKWGCCCITACFLAAGGQKHAERGSGTRAVKTRALRSIAKVFHCLCQWVSLHGNGGTQACHPGIASTDIYNKMDTPGKLTAKARRLAMPLQRHCSARVQRVLANMRVLSSGAALGFCFHCTRVNHCRACTALDASVQKRNTHLDYHTCAIVRKRRALLLHT